MNNKPPKLSLPGTKKPPQQPDFGLTIQTIAEQEIERVGRDRHAVFEAVMMRILRDEALFRRIAMALLHQAFRKRIKKSLHRLSLIDQIKGTKQ